MGRWGRQGQQGQRDRRVSQESLGPQGRQEIRGSEEIKAYRDNLESLDHRGQRERRVRLALKGKLGHGEKEAKRVTQE